MATHTFSTNTHCVRMRIVKWLFIGAGIFIVLGNIYKIVDGADANLLNLFTGTCILFMGLFFDHYHKNISIRIDDETIRHHRFQTGLMPEKEQTYYWRDIKKVILKNGSIRLVEHNATNKKLRLPYYMTDQFQDLKKLLATQAAQHNAYFEIKS